jgi:hypothetical protein
MKLLLDVGNSRLKWAWLSTDGLVGSGHDTSEGRSSEVLADRCAIARFPTRCESQCCWASAAALVAEVVSARFGRSAVFARSRDAAYGLRNGYRDPRPAGCRPLAGDVRGMAEVFWSAMRRRCGYSCHDRRHNGRWGPLWWADPPGHVL